MLRQSTPAHGEDVSGIKGAPVVKGSTPAVEHDENLLTSDLPYCGRAYQVGILPVHGLQFHSRLEVVFGRTRWLLDVNKHTNQ